MIRIDTIWLVTEPMDMRAGTTSPPMPLRLPISDPPRDQPPQGCGRLFL